MSRAVVAGHITFRVGELFNFLDSPSFLVVPLDRPFDDTACSLQHLSDGLGLVLSLAEVDSFVGLVIFKFARKWVVTGVLCTL